MWLKTWAHLSTVLQVLYNTELAVCCSLCLIRQQGVVLFAHLRSRIFAPTILPPLQGSGPLACGS